MQGYVDGFVLLVPKKNLKAYQKMAETAGKVWMEHGALEYVESVGDDIKKGKGFLPFQKLAKPRKGELILFSWILYKSKAHRNQVNAKVMKDKRIKAMMNAGDVFDCTRMAYGGFSAIVNPDLGWRH